MASSKVIVENFGFGDIPKKKDQYYIQTWHGDRAFKKVLYDSTFGDGSLFLPESVRGFCDLCVAGSDYGEKQYRSAFHYNGEILKVGTPRDDILLHVNDELVLRIKRYIGLEDNTKYLLYAPTLRRENQNNRQKQSIQGIDILVTLSTFEKQYGGSWKCLLRAHPGVTGLKGSGTEDKRIIDVSNYPDMTDLMIAADALITDYSSCAGDFALLRRPIFLFQDDIEEYLKNDRTFYFEMEKSPYLIAHSQDELITIINSITLEEAAINCDKILEFYGTHESGDAAVTVARRIIDCCNGWGDKNG
jgi:CDP-glycerol glycerophosphotransferase